MTHDPVVADVRRVRDVHAAKFGYDLDAIFLDIKQMERESGRHYVRFPPVPAKSVTTIPESE